MITQNNVIHLKKKETVTVLFKFITFRNIDDEAQQSTIHIVIIMQNYLFIYRGCEGNHNHSIQEQIRGPEKLQYIFQRGARKGTRIIYINTVN